MEIIVLGIVFIVIGYVLSIILWRYGALLYVVYLIITIIAAFGAGAGAIAIFIGLLIGSNLHDDNRKRSGKI